MELIRFPFPCAANPTAFAAHICLRMYVETRKVQPGPTVLLAQLAPYLLGLLKKTRPGLIIALPTEFSDKWREEIKECVWLP